MELEKDKIDLIKKIIINDKKYLDNEDLFDDFFNETCKRSFLIIKSVKNESSLEAYLRKIVTTSIIQVLKDSGRVRRTQSGFVKVEEKPLEQVISQTLEETIPQTVEPIENSIPTEIIPENKYSNVKINYDIIDMSETPEEVVIKKEILQKLYDTISIANNLNPQKQYLQLYNMRYVKSLKQKEIAQELNLSQSEVSKRLLELMNEVKTAFNTVDE